MDWRAILKINEYLDQWAASLGSGLYVLLFAIVFCETGLVVTPFLPGDSLLFAAGTFAALGKLDVYLLAGLLMVAAILGDTVNYWVGARIGARAFDGSIKYLKKEHLQRTHDFYEKHGRKTIVLARFVPIIRTFAPFVAGVGSMSYPVFLAYNVAGGVLWVGLLVGAGYKFGNIPVVRENFGIVIMAIIVISTLPIVWEYWKARRRAAAARRAA